jgi:hypothetical protein
VVPARYSALNPSDAGHGYDRQNNLVDIAPDKSKRN